jgi:hypothetical protein
MKLRTKQLCENQIQCLEDDLKLIKKSIAEERPEALKNGLTFIKNHIQTILDELEYQEKKIK